MARVHACPSCGGAVDEGARRCPYCASPVATLRCARCFHMNVAAALHCSGCGHELGLEPVPQAATLPCPRCDTPFQAFGGGEDGLLHDCGGCGGQFVEIRLLRELLERRATYGALAPRRARAAREELAPVRYVPCPVCRTMMNRKNFAGTSGVIVDVCRAHGVWLDAGELPRILAFVDSGGLVRALQQDRDATLGTQPGEGTRYRTLEREQRTPVIEAASVDDVADGALRLLEVVLSALLTPNTRAFGR